MNETYSIYITVLFLGLFSKMHQESQVHQLLMGTSSNHLKK